MLPEWPPTDPVGNSFHQVALPPGFTQEDNELLKYYFVYGQIKYPSYLRTPENQFSFIITISVK